MKKMVAISVLALLISSLGNSVIWGANPHSRPSVMWNNNPPPVVSHSNQEDASYIIHRSAAIVSTAQQFASQGKRYDGLGFAVAHQVYARSLYYQGSYSRAIYHSLRARALAGQVIRQNRNTPIYDALYDRTEDKYLREMPSDGELDQRLRDARIPVMNDQTAAYTNVPLDI